MLISDVQQTSGSPWQPAGWQRHDVRYIPAYGEAAVGPVVERLADLLGLVGHAEVACLVEQLAQAVHDRAFVLQLGPAQEFFDDAHPRQVDDHLQLLDAVGKYLAFMLPRPLVSIGTLAGNYARFCQDATEEVRDQTLTSYWGDMVNAMSPNRWGRRPDANRMLWAYEAAELTLSWIRAHRMPVYTSHECANLYFEQALTRPIGGATAFYASSAHLLTVDGACLFPGSAHLAYLQGVANPVAVRVGPHLLPERLRSVCRSLNPGAVAGKLLLITSLGDQVSALPSLLRAVQDEGMPVVWMCDPLRANVCTEQARGVPLPMSAMADEVESTVTLHASQHSHLGGLHISALPASLARADRPAQFNFTQALQVCSHFAHADTRSR